MIVLAKELGITVEERSVDRTDLYLCVEAFLAAPFGDHTVVSVDKYVVGNGAGGAMTEKLHQDI